MTKLNKDEKIYNLSKIILTSRSLLKNVLMALNRPVKNTSKKECYNVLDTLQEIYKTNQYCDDTIFLDQIEKGDAV